jgi:hypothetical protein
MPVYLLHSTIAAPRGNTRGVMHYVGFTTERNLWQRLAMHASGRSRIALLEKWHQMGAKLLLTMLVPDGTTSLERYLKRNGHYEKVCPLCTGELPPTQAFDIANVLTFRTAHGGPRSLKPTASVLATSSSGTHSSKCGLYLQLLLPSSRIASRSGAVPMPPHPGGSGSSATALQRKLAERSAITRRRLSGDSRHNTPTEGPANQLKLVLERHLQTVPMWATNIADDSLGKVVGARTEGQR